MRNLLFREAASADLEAILEYIGRDNPTRAVTFTNELRQQCQNIATLPGTLGRSRAELLPNMRSWAYKGYVILFTYKEGTIEIINVLDGRRDIDAYFNE